MIPVTIRPEPGDADPLSLRGIVPPTFTAFDDDESIDEAMTRAHVRFLVDSGVHGVFPLGTNGEFPLLSPAERDRVVEIVVDEVGGDVPVLAGVGAPSTRETVERAEHAANVGADGLVVVTPYYFPVDDDGLVAHYERVASTVDRPLYVYNIPKRAGNDVSLDALDRLFDVDGVVGMKDSRGDLGLLGEAARAHPEHTFLVGADALLFGGLLHGCSGAVSGVANVFPGLVVELYDAVLDGDLERARERQGVVYDVRSALQEGPHLAGVKTALELRGFDVGPLRAPLRRLDDEGTDRLADRLREIHGAAGLDSPYEAR